MNCWSLLVLAALAHAAQPAHNFIADANDVKKMMESANVATSTSSTAKVEMPKIEADGEIDMPDHQLDAELEKEAKSMETSMAQRVQAGDAPKKQLAAVATKVQSGEQTMTRQLRAERWLNSHGMQKMGNILAGHASKASTKAVEAKPSSQ